MKRSLHQCLAVVLCTITLIFALAMASTAVALPATKIVLPNGLVAIIKPEPGSGLVAVEAFVKAGAAEERDTQIGIGNVVARALLSSTRSRSQERLAEAFYETGGAFQTEWHPDFTEVSAITTVSHFDDAVNVMADVLLNAAFDPATVNQTIDDQLNEIKGYADDVAGTAYIQELGELYQDGPYRRPKGGFSYTVRKLTRDDLVAFYQKYYVPSNIVISIAGDVTPEQVTERLNKSFAGTSGTTPTPFRKPVDETLARSTSKVVEKDISAAYIVLGYLAPSVSNPDFAALTVLNSILGGGKASRLFVDIREKRGIGYEIGTSYPVSKYQSHMLAMLVTDLYKPAAPGSPSEVALQDVKDAILAEVALLKNQPVTDEELLRGKRYTIGTYALQHQRLRERAYMLGWMETIGAGYQFDTAYNNMIESVTKADVQRVARKYFTNYALVMSIPKSPGEAASAFGK